ncbi:MAG: TolC family outer membrane protein [Motiliproteus sp.]
MKKQLICAAILSATALSSNVTLAQTLPEAMLDSLRHNPDLSIVMHQYQARGAAVEVAKGGYLPSVDLDGGYGYEETDSPSTRSVDDDHEKELNRGELQLTLRQLLFDGFRTRNDVDRTSAEFEAHRYVLQATAEDLALRVADVYLEVLFAERARDLAQQNLQSHQLIYDKISKRTEQGIGSTSDLSQVDGRLARAESNVIVTENNLLDSQSKFKRLVGTLPQNLQQPELLLSQLPASLAEAEQQALESHPRLVGARLDLDAAGYKIDQLKGNYSPQVYFELGSSWNDDLDGVEGHNNDTTAMIRMNYNLFAGGKDKYQIKEAASQRGEAADILRNASDQVSEGLELSWNAHQALSRQEGFLARHTTASKETLVAYRKQFGLGRRSLMDLLDTENERFEAEADLLQAIRDKQIAEYRILNATGELLNTLQIQVPQS